LAAILDVLLEVFGGHLGFQPHELLEVFVFGGHLGFQPVLLETSPEALLNFS
jgi:hypothetical protein